MKHLVLIGIQGSGKGTQARFLQKHGYNIFEMGGELRAFASGDTPESLQLKQVMESGQLASNDLVIAMLRAFALKAEGHIAFDGVPRNLAQLPAFDEVFPAYEVIYLDLNEEQAMKRLMGRRVDSLTGQAFASDFPGGINPATGNPLIRRSDDTLEGATRRISAFQESTLPLLDAWKAQGKTVHRIDASLSEAQVSQQIQTALAA